MTTLDDSERRIELMPPEVYEPIEEQAVTKLAGMVNQAQFRSLVLILGLGEAVGRVRDKVSSS